MTATKPRQPIGQRSLGDPSLLFPLYPPLLRAARAPAAQDMQYPLEIDYDYSRISKNVFGSRRCPVSGAGRRCCRPGTGTCRWAKAEPR